MVQNHFYKIITSMEAKKMKMKVFLKIASFFLAICIFSMPAFAGELEPPASAVDGAGNPVPTEPTFPSWSRILPSAERYVPALNGGAVLDRETGLVWAYSPTASSYTWASAIKYCMNYSVNNRTGWHLPTSEELLSVRRGSLIDPGFFDDTKLPDGRKFWSSTTNSIDPDQAQAITVGISIAFHYQKLMSYGVWCVRGPR